MSAIYILWLRELKRYVRSRAQIVASLGQPLLYLLALGFGLGPVFQRAGYGSYIQLLAPGVDGAVLHLGQDTSMDLSVEQADVTRLEVDAITMRVMKAKEFLMQFMARSFRRRRSGLSISGRTSMSSRR